MQLVETARIIPASCRDVFQLCTDLQQLPTLMRGRLEIHFPNELPVLEADMKFQLKMTRLGISASYLCQVDAFQPFEKWTYHLESGPMRSWYHTQKFEPVVAEKNMGRGSFTKMTDIVEYDLGFSIFGALADDLLVRKEIGRLLDYRSEQIHQFFYRLGMAL